MCIYCSSDKKWHHNYDKCEQSQTGLHHFARQYHLSNPWWYGWREENCYLWTLFTSTEVSITHYYMTSGLPDQMFPCIRNLVSDCPSSLSLTLCDLFSCLCFWYLNVC